jgi:two-component system chemotaxis response regulator CheB
MTIANSGAPAGKTKVLIIDDSALVRSLMSAIIDSQPDMCAVGAAPNPLVAREMIRALDPDVLTLDVEMPKMDGIEFLDRLMRLHPMPVLMVSSLTERGADVTMRALELGAVDFVTKPKIGIADGLNGSAGDIVDKIRIAARARVKRHALPGAGGGAPRKRIERSGYSGTEKLILVGSSTGGTEALREMLLDFPPDCPGTLITQHMPAGFTKSFALRLDSLCRISVKEAEHGERVLPGHAYIAPGDRHLSVVRSGANYVTQISDDPPVNRHRPSVEVLFRSGARFVGGNAFGIMLTGMGKDGAQAMVELRQSGAWTIAQDEASCVVFGMPKEAIALGAVEEILPLGEIAGQVFKRLGAAGMRAMRV